MPSKQAKPKLLTHPHAMQGTLAEHMVIVDLLKLGYSAQLSAAGMRYDVIVDLGYRFIRIQVKSTKDQRTAPGQNQPNTYKFRIKSKSRGKKLYEVGDFDLLACVTMDLGYIAYLPFKEALKHTVQLKPPGALQHLRRKNNFTIADFPFSKALKELL